MIYSGEISDIDAQRGYVKVNIPDLGNVTEWIPFGRDFTLGNSQSIPITINTQVLVCKTYSNRWFVLRATPNDEDKPYDGANENKWGAMFADGTLIEYDIENHKLTINSTVASVEVSALSVKITAPEITLEGAVTVQGELTAAAGLSVSGGNLTSEGDVMVGDISFNRHTHGGVTTGAGVTGIPLDI